MLSSKIAVIDSQLNRAKVLRKEKLNSELKKIYQILKQNNYPKELIDRRFEHIFKRNSTQNLSESQINEPIFVTIPYIKGVSEQIAKVFKKFNGKITYRRIRNDLYKCFYNNKDKISNELKPGVYQINCKNCEKKYFGETKRYFKVRKNEHRLATVNKKTNLSNIAEHVIETNHEIDWENSKVIKTVSEDFSRKIYESIAIRTAKEKHLMNKNTGEFLPYIWLKHIKPLNNIMHSNNQNNSSR